MDMRTARPDDAPRISALVRDLTCKYIAHEFSEQGAGRLLEPMSEAAIEGYLESGYRYHVAEENGELAGVIAIRGNRHLYHLFVSERFQGKGVARRLWDVAKAASLDAGNPGVFTVNSSRYAVGLYETFGFVGQSEAIDRSGVIFIPMKLESAIRE
ncbi:GNAT family N-acetyltransferase [Methyloparacoccus murrellii]